MDKEQNDRDAHLLLWGIIPLTAILWPTGFLLLVWLLEHKTSMGDMGILAIAFGGWGICSFLIAKAICEHKAGRVDAKPNHD